MARFATLFVLMLTGYAHSACMCTKQYDPVCCNSRTYSNKCEALCNPANMASMVQHGPCSQLKQPAPVEEELHCTGECQSGVNLSSVMSTKNLKRLKEVEREECVLRGMCPNLRATAQNVDLPCVNGKAGEYPCQDVDLLSFTPLAQMGGKAGIEGADIWGWTDTSSGREFALMTLTDGTSFVEVTKPSHPVYLGFLPSNSREPSLWRDVKVFKNHAYIVSENEGHGMQIFDLAQLLSFGEGALPTQFKANALYTEFGSCHNVVINEQSGYAYGVGSTTCNGGLHMVDIKQPLHPKFVGCFGEDGYVHDAQCVIYTGPDTRFENREICFSYNEDSLTIVDVHDKKAPKMLSRVKYEGYAYSHQGWLINDMTHLLLDDELDEADGVNNGFTETYVWNVESLTEPKNIGNYHAAVQSCDHNLYIVDNTAYLANYQSGLRILDIADIKQAQLKEIAYFDVHPEEDGLQFFGAWSVYPYFKSGNLLVSSIERGLFVLRHNVSK